MFLLIFVFHLQWPMFINSRYIYISDLLTFQSVPRYVQSCVQESAYKGSLATTIMGKCDSLSLSLSLSQTPKATEYRG